MILILDMYHKTGCKISIIILAWNLILSSSHPRQFLIISCPFQASHAVSKHIFFDFLMDNLI